MFRIIVCSSRERGFTDDIIPRDDCVFAGVIDPGGGLLPAGETGIPVFMDEGLPPGCVNGEVEGTCFAGGFCNAGILDFSIGLILSFGFTEPGAVLVIGLGIEFGVPELSNGI